MEELKVADGVEDREMVSVEDEDEDEDLDVESDRLVDEDDDAVRDVVREGEGEAVALIEAVGASVAERERLWLWLNVEDPNPDVVELEDMVMELLNDMETLDDEEGVLLGDVDGETLEVELEEVVEDILVLWDTAVVGEVLELEDAVAEPVVL
uniref:Uncharacterized protein n=1 Tax=viral metagenome TaxID=1070528 RepID=A0A6C0K5I6_9ZZZZ